MTTKSSPRRRAGYSDLAIPPGEGLQEETEYRGISPQQLADRCDEPVEYIQRVFTGRQEITPAFAQNLEKILGIPAQTWLNLEQLYQQTLAHNGQTRPEA